MIFMLIKDVQVFVRGEKVINEVSLSRTSHHR